VTGHAPEPAAVGFQFHFGPASRTDQDFEEFCADCHVFIKRLVYLIGGLSLGRIVLFHFPRKAGNVYDDPLVRAFTNNLFTPARLHPEFRAPFVD